MAFLAEVYEKGIGAVIRDNINTRIF